MRAVVYEDVGKVRVDEVDEPAIRDPDDVIVRVTASAICGSDMHFYHGKAPLQPGDPMGHEGAGVVERAGPEARGVAQGDRVVIAFDNVCGACWYCRRGQTSLCESFASLGIGLLGGDLGGTQADLVRIPHGGVNLLPIPHGMEDERALFLGDILTTGYYGAAIGRIEPGDTVAVIGAGPVGYFAAQAARLHDPAQVLVLDREQDRLALAEAVGATSIDVSERNPQSAVDGLTDGRGADVVIDAVGSEPAWDSAIHVVRPGGTVVVLGMYVAESVPLQLGVAWARMMTFVFGGICPVHAWWERALEAVAGGAIDPMPLISHRLSLEEAPRGYELFAAREATKVVLVP